jgi:SAM-dependent methyltransferase
MNPPQWNELTATQQSEFLLGGVKLENWYHNDTTTHLRKFTFNDVEEMISNAKKRMQGVSYGNTDTWLYDALDSCTVTDKTVAVMGSILPWYESIVLANGGQPTTIDYNQTYYDHQDIKQITIDDYWKNPYQFDCAFSISSFEHDGLGRYGDPINPNGDLRAMKEMKKIIKKDGLLYLAVPTGVDKVVWNAHRVYGNIRFPLLFDQWEVVGTVGMEEHLMETDFGISGVYQPIIVLKNI